jgi:2-iminobutanoate/2-iminopropanoate deaminase
MAFEVVSGPDIPPSALPFSPATKAGGFVFVSGQASVGPDGKIIKDTFENEFRRTVENVKKILAAAGLGLVDVVRVQAYLADPADLPRYNELYREYFKTPLPARTTLTHCIPSDLIKFEMDVIAYAGE